MHSHQQVYVELKVFLIRCEERGAEILAGYSDTRGFYDCERLFHFLARGNVVAQLATRSREPIEDCSAAQLIANVSADLQCLAESVQGFPGITQLKVTISNVGERICLSI